MQLAGRTSNSPIDSLRRMEFVRQERDPGLHDASLVGWPEPLGEQKEHDFTAQRLRPPS